MILQQLFFIVFPELPWLPFSSWGEISPPVGTSLLLTWLRISKLVLNFLWQKKNKTKLGIIIVVDSHVVTVNRIALWTQLRMSWSVWRRLERHSVKGLARLSDPIAWRSADRYGIYRKWAAMAINFVYRSEWYTSFLFQRFNLGVKLYYKIMEAMLKSVLYFLFSLPTESISATFPIKVFTISYFINLLKNTFKPTIKHRASNSHEHQQIWSESENASLIFAFCRKRNGCRSRISGVYLNQIEGTLLTASCCLHWLCIRNLIVFTIVTLIWFLFQQTSQRLHVPHVAASLWPGGGHGNVWRCVL